MPLGILAALVAMLALALPSLASADPLTGSATFYKSGLRSTAFDRTVTPGPDGNVWFIDDKALSAGKPGIGRITPAGTITEYCATGCTNTLSGLNAEANLKTIVAGPGASKYLWFTDRGSTPAIGVIDSTSPETATEFSVVAKGGNAGSKPTGIAVGPEGNLWFTDESETTKAIGVAVLSSENEIEKIEEFSTGLSSSGTGTGDLAEGSPTVSNVSVGSGVFKVGQEIQGEGISAGTTITACSPSCASPTSLTLSNPALKSGTGVALTTTWTSRPRGIVAGPDGNLWFTSNNPESGASAVGRIDPSTHAIELFSTGFGSLPGGASEYGPFGIVVGPDENIWFTEPAVTNGPALCRVLTSGEVGKYSCFNEGLIASSKPTGLTAAPGGKLWFADESGVSEEQEVEIAATGGTYKLGYKGKETGATGTGNVMHTAKGAGEVKRFTSTNCKRTSTSKELKECTTVFGAEVGMFISGTGIPAETTIEKVEEVGKKIFLTNAATSGTGTNTTVTAGWVKNLTVETGTFEVGMPLTTTASNFLAGTIILSIGEEGGKKIIVPSKAPGSANATATVEGNKEKKVITNPTTSTGAFVKGEEISGTGITAGTTISAINTTQKTLTLSAEATAEGTGVSLSADLPYNAQETLIEEALVKLSTIGVLGVGVSNKGEAPYLRSVTFSATNKHADVEQLSCNGAGLTGGSCSVTTIKQGVPNAIGCMTTAGETCGRYPFAELYGGPSGIVYMPGGNVWLATGAGESLGIPSSSSIAKFGIEPELAVEVTCTGSGSGTVSPIDCGESAEYESGEEVTLTATPAEGSKFTGWSGCSSESEGKCIVEVSGFEDIEVEAEFEKVGPTNRRTLTVTKSAGGSGGIGTVKSKPKGINCGTACNKAVGSFYETGPTPSNVILTAKPSLTSTFVEWTGACSGSELTCTVSMTEDKEVGAVFGGTSKAIVNPQALTVTKDESTGFGTVKGKPGLYCEAECTETTVLYQGPASPKTVELSALAAFGSEFVEWGGACSGSEPTCSVTMTEAKEVSATFEAKPTVALTIAKNTEEGNYTSGTGTVTSKPKGLKCGSTCITQTMSAPVGEAIVLKEKPALGMTFTGWEGGGCSGTAETCTVSLAEADTVVAKFSGSPKAIASPQALTLTKGGSGFGTVKGSGLYCEALCTSATLLYKGEPPMTVTLEAIPALGSKAVVWSGCESEPEGKCVVSMSGAKAVTATFDELE